jgi:hypothetical protein
MPVDTPHPEYDAHKDQWERCRDTREGSDAVKAKKEKYLPRLDSMAKGDLRSEARYAAFLVRAYFYNAVGRTVEGLTGAIFQKDPIFEAPDPIEEHLDDITMGGLSAAAFTLTVTGEVVSIGRVGVLVDMSADPAPEKQRPYWALYEAEDIRSWRTERIAGDEVLTRVVLREMAEEPDPKDEFVAKHVEQYRVLVLTPGPAGPTYMQAVYRKNTDGHWVLTDTVNPTRRGAPLDYIPFVFIGPTATSPCVEKPPLLDLVDVNLSHYRNMGTLEHGLHHTGTPTLVISDDKTQSASAPFEFGSGVALMLATAGKAEILQADGENLGALERAAERKKGDMATLGAALLEEQTKVAETATAVGMRQAGRHATLRTIAGSVERGVSLALRIHAWWVGTGDLEAIKASVQLNKEFFALQMTPAQAKDIVLTWQAGGSSWKTTYFNLQRGGMTRPEVTAEQERAEIEAEEAMRPEPPEPTPPKPGDPPVKMPPNPAVA